MNKQEVERLRRWFRSEARDLPWREEPSPYGVWVSEVMLQQTQVSVVIPYFLAWMERFPSIESLADATLEDVLKSWEGLGYYSRARNLHQGARQVMERFGGVLPRNSEELGQIRGLGPYTVGAIRAFAFRERAAAVDGNVLRVLARYYGIEDEITKASTQEVIRTKALSLLPEKEPWVITEALIELGARVCARTARCGECPLSSGCEARRSGRQEELPKRAVRPKITALYRAVAVIMCDDYLLVTQGKQGEIMQDLYEFPYFETNKEGICARKVAELCFKDLTVDARCIAELPEVRHSFTRFRVKLRPLLLHTTARPAIAAGRWIHKEEAVKLPFSAGHRKVLAQLEY